MLKRRKREKDEKAKISSLKKEFEERSSHLKKKINIDQFAHRSNRMIGQMEMINVRNVINAKLRPINSKMVFL